MFTEPANESSIPVFLCILVSESDRLEVAKPYLVSSLQGVSKSMMKVRGGGQALLSLLRGFRQPESPASSP